MLGDYCSERVISSHEALGWAKFADQEDYDSGECLYGHIQWRTLSA
jgi:hypothetical protein